MPLKKIGRRLGKSGRHKAKISDESTRLAAEKAVDPSCQENSRSSIQTPLAVPQTDTGRWDENSKVLVRTLVQELGKMCP